MKREAAIESSQRRDSTATLKFSYRGQMLSQSRVIGQRSKTFFALSAAETRPETAGSVNSGRMLLKG